MMSYAFSLTGRSHLAENLVCQDAHVIQKLDNNLMLAAVADGVGSAALSDIGASLAVKTIGEYCIKNIPCERTAVSLVPLLQNGFSAALKAITARAEQEQISIDQYDTTLTAVLYDGSRIIFGQSGDGGIIGMDAMGHYTLLTKVQKGDAYNEVCPLRSGNDSWVFAEAPGEYVGVLLMTDGVLDVAVPPFLSNEPEELYINFIRNFLNPHIAAKSSLENTALVNDCEKFLQSEQCAAITDDMTVAAMWNSNAICREPQNDYYKEPDWLALRQERFYRLYPHLRAKEEQAQYDCLEQQE